MIRTSFNAGWEFRRKVNPFDEIGVPATPYRPVTLPHDAMLDGDRDPSGDPATGYFPGGTFEYRKTFTVAEEFRGRRMLLEFEGVYRDATVYVNGAFAGQRPSGYARFHVDVDRFLRFGAENQIRVEARSHQDSRWYSGCGIYRDTWLLTGDLLRIAPDGVRVNTPDIDAERAVVEVVTTLVNDSIEIHTVPVVVVVHDDTGTEAATGSTVVTVLPGEPAIVRHRLCLSSPRRWSTDTPVLYTAVVTVPGRDRATVRFGVRDLRLDPEHGLRINGETVKLRGACIHHDGGPLGAATFAAAEMRRVRLLKEAGFNAIRMSHHPAAVALLDACDRLGMLVIDEAFDAWTHGKKEFDYHLSFDQWWERDLESMVAKDVNHPSVIMYSIGNEIPEAGSPTGAAWGRRLAEKVRSLDGTRFVTNGINNMLAVAPYLDEQDLAAGIDDATGINTLMSEHGDVFNTIAASDLVTERTAESYAVLDVAGMNYSDARYTLDRQLFPGRIILGTETFATRIDIIWELVGRHGHVIGDFTWTGWDYLGEAGIGRPQFGGSSFSGPYPQLVAGCGDLDITGHRRPASYYREIVFGRRTEPFIAVRDPRHHGKTFTGTPWAWSDTTGSWTWPGFDGEPITVEVYADADEVELALDNRPLGRQPVDRFRAVFETVYQPGELSVTAYRASTVIGRHSVRTASGVACLNAEADRRTITTASGDLAFVAFTLTDAAGTVHTAADRPVTVEVTGAGVLAGFGSADPAGEQRFDAVTQNTYHGRALAVLRPTGPGLIRLRATAPGLDDADVTIEVTG